MINKTEKFREFLEELILVLLKLVPQHLVMTPIIERYRWKKVGLSNIQNRQDRIEEVDDMIGEFSNKRKYASLVKLIEFSLEKSIEDTFIDKNVSGIIHSGSNREPTYVRMKNHFSGEFRFDTSKIEAWHKKEYISFKSEVIEGFSLQFEFSPSFSYKSTYNDEYLNYEIRKRLSERMENGEAINEEIFKETIFKVLNERDITFETLITDIIRKK